MLMQNNAPFFRCSSAHSLPLWVSMIEWLIDSPKPIPSSLLVW